MTWRDDAEFRLDALRVQRQRRRQAWGWWRRITAIRWPDLLP